MFRPHMFTPIVLTDLDNTIYNWVDFFAPSFRAMVQVLNRETSIEEKVIIEDFKQVYQNRGSLEYAFSIQELQLCQHMHEAQICELVRKAKDAFSRVRQINLLPYPAVKETLIWAMNKGIKVVGVTNSPLFHAMRRLGQLNLDGLFYGLAGWEGYEVPETYSWTRSIKERAGQGGYKTQIKRLWSLTEEELKPNPIGYLRILTELRTSHKITYIVGDSLSKDIQPALDIGAIAVWAKYGEVFDNKNFETLLQITHWSEEKIDSVYNVKDINPAFTISSFSELMKIVETPQADMFKSS